MENKPISVYEFDRISVGHPLNAEEFAELRSFILKQEEGASGSTLTDTEMEEAGACMKLSAVRGVETLTVRNYVGTIMLKSGTTIEILPKVFSDGDSDEENKGKARALVMDMLQACGLISYKKFQNAALNAIKYSSIFEVYVRLFIDEVFLLYKKGLKSGYEYKEENEKFLKGKLVFSQHLKRNFAHAERFYVAYEEFSVNRPENRLIKTTLELLNRISKNGSNKKDLRRLLLTFEEIDSSKHVQSDFQKCTGGRNMKEYEKVLSFCKIFLSGYSFSSYAGKHDVIALLFPMEKLFEGYIAKRIAEKFADWEVYPQYNEKYLFEAPQMFRLRPDIYLRNRKDPNRVVLMDTKWKTLSYHEQSNYGISQADMYQMYAYHKRFANVEKVILLYPTLDKRNGLSWKNPAEKIEIYAEFLPVYFDECGEKKMKFNLEPLEKLLQTNKIP